MKLFDNEYLIFEVKGQDGSVYKKNANRLSVSGGFVCFHDNKGCVTGVENNPLYVRYIGFLEPEVVSVDDEEYTARRNVEAKVK